VSQNRQEAVIVRTLLAVESPHGGESLRNLIDHKAGLEVVAEVADPIDLLLGVKKWGAELVMQEWPAEEIPGICSHLVIEYPDLLVIGVPRDSQDAFLCRLTVTKTRFPKCKLHEVLARIRRRR
jgi:hypothetical protein